MEATSERHSDVPAMLQAEEAEGKLNKEEFLPSKG